MIHTYVYKATTKLLYNHDIIIRLQNMQDVLKSLRTQVSCSEDGDNYYTCRNSQMQ